MIGAQPMLTYTVLLLGAKCQFCAFNTFRENVWTNRQTNKQTNKQTNRTKII